MTATQQLIAMMKNLFQWWVTITPWQQGVRVRFGKHVKLIGPGLHFKMPFFDTVYMQAIRVRAQHIHNQTLTTKDGKSLTLASAIQYQITDLLTVYEKIHNAHDLIEQKVQSSVANNVYSRPLSEITPSELELMVLKDLNFEEFGLEIKGFNITAFALVKSYRLINGDMGSYTGYDQRFDTDTVMGEAKPN